MGLNPQQRAIVDALDAPVSVAAGAGTGKTFTLTRRIVACVKRMLDAQDDGNIGPMQRILAITFTTKAAEELRSRVRSALLAEATETGDERLRACALDVDNAWISTIHAMASRILKENALEFAIDPTFEVLTTEESDAIFVNALNGVLEQARLEEDPAMRDLLAKVSLYGKGANSYSIVSMISDIASHAEYMPHGFDGIRYAPTNRRPTDLLRTLMEAAGPVRDILATGSWTGSEEAARASNLDAMDAAIASARQALDAGMTGSFEDASLDAGTFLALVFAFPPTTNRFPSKTKEYQGDFARYRHAYRDVANETLASIGSMRLASIIELARRVHGRVEAIKDRDRTLLSQGDLLRICNTMLAAPRNADVVRRYQDQFAYIMVDEFQDTDKLQMDIISKLARKRGDGSHASLSNLCTVGDMQQSIYRFRGGDVSLAKERSRELASVEGTRFELTANYRSHEDILNTVEMVFSQPDVFGPDFLRLDAASSSLDGAIAEAFEAKPRVTFDFSHYSTKRDVPAELARADAAWRIAKHFRTLIDAGVPAGRLAILLGRAFTANVYQQALAECGIESVVVKGSVFARTEEAQLVCDLVRFAANTDQEVSLFNVLVSDLFDVSDDDLLGMTTRIVDGVPMHVPLSVGFRTLAASIGSGHGHAQTPFTEGALRAARTLSEFVRNARSGSPSAALRKLFAASGVLFRLERSGPDGAPDALAIARSANLNKAADIISDLEGASSGIADVARRYEGFLATEKVTPGALSTTESEFVQIITVHSSKGLEYDHVAVAELKDGIERASRFVVENCGDSTYVAMKALDTEYDDKQLARVAAKVCGFTFDDDEPLDSEQDVVEAFDVRGSGPGACFDALASYARQQDFEEAQRLLYVAMTRAKETLYVSHIDGLDIDKPYKGIYGDIDAALTRHLDLDAPSRKEELRAIRMPIGYMRRRLDMGTLDEDELEHSLNILNGTSPAAGDDPCADTPMFEIPLYEDAPIPCLEPFTPGRQDVRSYTSLSKLLPHEGGADAADASAVAPVSGDAGIMLEEVPADAQRLHASDADKATDLGTAFHRLAQLAIIDASGSTGSFTLEMPDRGRVAAQIEACDLTDAQADRLAEALERWFASSECSTFAKSASILAEVPFAVSVDVRDPASDGAPSSAADSPATTFILEGEIDGLGILDDTSCLFIDYKTGGSPSETDEQLHHKHLLQAQCYAYALMANGFERVEAHFIRVEIQAPDDPCEPQIVKYLFESSDIDGLHSAIRRAYRYPVLDE